ncbi:MAG: cache domain-containing protein [bacterium]|jgi:hypothetical protein|nr:cache domain-containing protein [bacterium]
MKQQFRACSLLFTMLAVLTLAGTGSFGQTDPVIDARIGLNALVALTDSHFERLIDVMEVLAATSELQSGDWETIRPILAALKHVHIPGVYCWVKPDGSYYTVAKGKQIKNLADRGYFPTVMKGQPVVGDLLFSTSTGKKVSVNTVPIEQDGEIVSALIVSVFLETFSKYLIDQLKIPDDVYFFAIDDGGRIALHSDVELILKSRDFFQVSNVVQQAMKNMLQEKEGTATVEYHGVSRSVVFTTSPLTGWHFAIGVKNR